MRIKRASASGWLFSFSSAAATRAGVDDDSILLVGRLHLIEIALHRRALPHPMSTANRAELRAIDRHPLAAHQSHRARKPHQLRSCLGHRRAMHPPELG